MAGSLMSPGHRLPRRGVARADILARLTLAGIAVLLVLTGTVTLWLAGQVGGLLTHAAWPDSSPADMPGIAARFVTAPGDPEQAWPGAARQDLPPGPLLYGLWIVLFIAALAGVGVPALWVARRWARRRGFAGRKDLDRVVTAEAVLRRVDVLRPGLTIRDTDSAGMVTVKERRRSDPLEVARLLGRHALTGEPLYLANEYTELLAGAARFANKTSRYIIPRVADARGAVITTSTRLDVASVTYDLRAALGPTWIFEPQGQVPGVPRLRWSPIDGADDPDIAALRAKGFAAGAGLKGNVDNGQYFQDQAAAIIRGLLHAAALDEHATMTEVASWAANPSVPRAERILRHHGQTVWADRLAFHRESSGRSRDAIQSVVFGALDAFSNPRILHACSPPRGQQFDPEQWLDESGTLYLVGTRSGQALTAPLFAAIAEDIIYRTLQRSFVSPGGRVEPCLYLVGDEITNIAPLPSLPALASEGGGSGIALSIACQNTHQLEERWGRDGGQALRDGANARFVMGGTQDVNALKDAQALLGQVQELSSSASWGGGKASVQENTRREHLVDLAELRTLPTGHALVLLGNMPPVEVVQQAWWERPDADRFHTAQDAFNARLRRAS
ncbi:type IV secretory system conjugative DNA transfer family protein [Micromonospora peucetia]|uniref:TraM recognition site of TraD and TraG n=1 Tax=Micromonospora peucetia TaxID=47871 RepID=A0A1C6W4Y7_9ACTN|nr:TraM recognition domain-containing protein [Micromonospora peucetia]SCL73655.1 TraM recognition site of TraD and TraG [Micromonospora peucetia]